MVSVLTCKGNGKQPCEICDGKKYIPTAWSPNDNPWLNRQTNVIRLKNEQVVFGKVVMTTADDALVKTRENKFIHINASNILPTLGTNTQKQ